MCAYGGPGTIGPLIGQPIPVSSTVQAPRSIQTQPGIGAMIVVAPPQGALCWTITSIAFYYHVGLKHYTAKVAINMAACSTQRAAQRLEGPWTKGARRLNICAWGATDSPVSAAPSCPTQLVTSAAECTNRSRTSAPLTGRSRPELRHAAINAVWWTDPTGAALLAATAVVDEGGVQQDSPLLPKYAVLETPQGTAQVRIPAGTLALAW